VNEIALSNIEANPYNPRVEFDEEGLQELSESIKIHGLIQPITVRHLSGEKFQLISGERRLRASKMAGIETVPAYVRIAGDDAMLELALIENIQRQDLNAIEIANTYERLMDEMKITHETLAKRVGKKRSTVSNYLRLLKLPAVIQAAIKEEKITMGHAKALVNVENMSLVNVVCKEIIEQDLSVRKTEHYAKLFSKALPDLIQGLTSSVISLGHFEKISETPDIVIQLSVYKEVVRKRLSISETENLISQFLNGSNNSEKTKLNTETKLTAAYQRVKDNLKSLLSTKVDLKVDKNGKGQIVINFQDVEDLNRIIETIDK
jgi:ParB family chromosome partitioning protein